MKNKQPNGKVGRENERQQVQMADKYTKSLTIEEIEIKVIVRYDIVLIRLGKKTTLNTDKINQGCWKQEILYNTRRSINC